MMEPQKEHTIYTIGHSTHPLDVFIKMLEPFNIRVLADIRRFPGSRKYPQFNQDPLAAALQNAGIRYVHLEDLGGRRKARPDSENSRWRNEAFRGYADYMETDPFKTSIRLLETMALKQPLVYMCAEAVWWRCHRALVSDYLKAKGWTVLHIMGAGKTEIHPYTAPARVYKGQVFYSDESLFGS